MKLVFGLLQTEKDDPIGQLMSEKEMKCCTGTYNSSGMNDWSCIRTKKQNERPNERREHGLGSKHDPWWREFRPKDFQLSARPPMVHPGVETVD